MYYREYPVQDALDTKSDLLEWILRLKNAIQTRLGGRPTFTMTDYARNMESKFQIALFLWPSITVVVSITPDEVDTVPAFLQGLLEQTLLPSSVLLCVSEREDDPELEALFHTTYPDLKLVVLSTPDPQTPSQKKNRGIEYCLDKKNIDAIVLVRTTDILHPQKIWLMRQALLENPEALVIVHPTGGPSASFSGTIPTKTKVIRTEPFSPSFSVNHSQVLLHVKKCPDIRFHSERAENDLVRRVHKKYGHVRNLPHVLSMSNQS